MQRYYASLSEKERRRYAGIEAVKLGHGGISYISRVLSCDHKTIKFGMSELAGDMELNAGGIRRAGGGRKSAFETIEGLDEAFLRVVSPHTAGSSMDERIKWTNLSRPKIAELLADDGIRVSVTVVDQLLKKHTIVVVKCAKPEQRAAIPSVMRNLRISTSCANTTKPMAIP